MLDLVGLLYAPSTPPLRLKFIPYRKTLHTQVLLLSQGNVLPYEIQLFSYHNLATIELCLIVCYLCDLPFWLLYARSIHVPLLHTGLTPIKTWSFAFFSQLHAPLMCASCTQGSHQFIPATCSFLV